MFDINLMIGVGIIALILLYAAFKLWEIDHKMLALTFFYGAIICALLIPNVLYDFSENCYLVVSNSTLDGTGITNYAYSQQCYAQNTNVLDNFNGFYNMMIQISYWYLLMAFLIYLFGEGILNYVMKRFRR